MEKAKTKDEQQKTCCSDTEKITPEEVLYKEAYIKGYQQCTFFVCSVLIFFTVLTILLLVFTNGHFARFIMGAGDFIVDVTGFDPLSSLKKERLKRFENELKKEPYNRRAFENLPRMI